MRGHCRFFISVMLVHMAAFAFMGCARSPDAERSAARGSMTAAIAAGADRYAAADFRLAQSFWYTAESRITGRKYKEARRYYINAKTSFEKALAGVEAGRKAVATATSAALQGLENDWKNLKAQAGSASKNKKKHWAADEKTIAEGLTAARDMIAADAAGAAVKIKEIGSVIQNWTAVFEGAAAAPTKPYTPGKG